MKRTTLILVSLLIVCAQALGQATQPTPDVQTFDLTPSPPPTPALKYEFHYDIISDGLPGNAAQLYQDAILLLGPEGKDKSEKALDAYEAHDMQTFQSLADSLDNPGLYQELDIATRRENCNWDPPLHEMGAQTLLPHLEPIVHGLDRWIRVRALHQMEQGKIEDAIDTLRLGYGMADHVGTEPTLVSALVSLRITTEMNSALAVLMTRQDAPNLYFALCEFPGRQAIYHKSLYGERRFLLAGNSLLGKAVAGEDLSAEQWRQMLHDINALNEDSHHDPVKDATPENLQQARQIYAQSHHLDVEAVAKIDPIIVLGAYYVHQAEMTSDDQFKWRGLPYPMAIARMHQTAAAMDEVARQQPGNPFLPMLDLSTAVTKFAIVDRQMAALTIVEAIRSYAAGNGGKLPQRLEEMADTPAPANPATGKPFDYRVENGVATLSATEMNAPLTYTIRIRK